MRVGDTVVVVKTEQAMEELLGQTGVVREVRLGVPFPVCVDFKDDENIPFTLDELEVVE